MFITVHTSLSRKGDLLSSEELTFLLINCKSCVIQSTIVKTLESVTRRLLYSLHPTRYQTTIQWDSTARWTCISCHYYKRYISATTTTTTHETSNEYVSFIMMLFVAETFSLTHFRIVVSKHVLPLIVELL